MEKTFVFKLGSKLHSSVKNLVREATKSDFQEVLVEYDAIGKWKEVYEATKKLLLSKGKIYKLPWELYAGMCIPLALAGSWVALVEEDGVVGVVAVESSKEKVLDEIEEFDSEVVVL